MARNEKLIVRHPAPKPEDDRFMLDRWTPVEAHKTRQVYRDERKHEMGLPVFRRWFRVECLCGWRSAELPRPVAAECPVRVALAERARTIKRDGERVEWKAVEGDRT